MRITPLVLVLGVALAAACSGRQTTTGGGGRGPKATPTPWPRVENRDGTITTGPNGTSVYTDRKGGFTLTLPGGFSGRLVFETDPSGPPPAGQLKLRIADKEQPPCVIDVALEERAEGATLDATAIAQGREVFFVADVTGEPPIPLPGVEAVWAATLVPDPLRIDMGYWILARDLTLRMEGRFPVARLSPCKDALDSIARSLDSTKAAASKAGTTPG